MRTLEILTASGGDKVERGTRDEGLTGGGGGGGGGATVEAFSLGRMPQRLMDGGCEEGETPLKKSLASFLGASTDPSSDLRPEDLAKKSWAVEPGP